VSVSKDHLDLAMPEQRRERYQIDAGLAARVAKV